MRLDIALTAAIVLLGTGCAKQQEATGPAQTVRSLFTGLDAATCRKEPDKSDPNETPYLVCPGVAGYSLIVRRVDAGRRSIDVVDTAGQALPLNYQEVVTRHMFSLDQKAEWRVATADGKQEPVALVVRVNAREDNNQPEKVTATFLAIAKITPNGACVTDRVAAGAPSIAEIHSLADSARQKPCAPPLPPMKEGGVPIR